MKQYLIDSIPDISGITKIRGEASLRTFFRFLDRSDNSSKIGMVYPDKNKDEINKIKKFTNLYKQHEINVPNIYKTVGDRLVILEDLGKLSFQRAFLKSNNIQKKELLEKTAIILSKLQDIPVNETENTLGPDRLKNEMDFFLKYYIENSLSKLKKEDLKKKLYFIVESISDNPVFSHRDFHSRNMHIYNDEIYLIDFQDSLQGPLYYDIVSFSSDSYLDLGLLKSYFYSILNELNIHINEEQHNLTALQRNIKALGTYGYQINIRKNLSYKKYINRGLSHIRDNPQAKLIEKLLF